MSFIFFFNSSVNPLNFIYGTVIILVLANMVHFYSVPFVTASSALKKLDREYENVADSMKIPGWKSFLRIVAPLSLPAILEIFPLLLYELHGDGFCGGVPIQRPV